MPKTISNRLNHLHCEWREKLLRTLEAVGLDFQPSIPVGWHVFHAKSIERSTDGWWFEFRAASPPVGAPNDLWPTWRRLNAGSVQSWSLPTARDVAPTSRRATPSRRLSSSIAHFCVYFRVNSISSECLWLPIISVIKVYQRWTLKHAVVYLLFFYGWKEINNLTRWRFWLERAKVARNHLLLLFYILQK